jgi:hypothetical protein
MPFRINPGGEGEVPGVLNQPAATVASTERMNRKWRRPGRTQGAGACWPVALSGLRQLLKLGSIPCHPAPARATLCEQWRLIETQGNAGRSTGRAGAGPAGDWSLTLGNRTGKEQVVARRPSAWADDLRVRPAAPAVGPGGPARLARRSLSDHPARHLMSAPSRCFLYAAGVAPRSPGSRLRTPGRPQVGHAPVPPWEVPGPLTESRATIPVAAQAVSVLQV